MYLLLVKSVSKYLIMAHFSREDLGGTVRHRVVDPLYVLRAEHALVSVPTLVVHLRYACLGINLWNRRRCVLNTCGSNPCP